MASAPVTDALKRPLTDLRISVTDRCNFRCRYCMPREAFEDRHFLEQGQLLSFEETARLARLAVGLGVQKIRLTGGEPLLRRDLPVLVEQLAGLDVDLALTTNGVLLPRVASRLKAAGLGRVTVSLDALDPQVFRRVCDAGPTGPGDVLAGVAAAVAAGFDSVKINCVLRRGLNDDQLEPLVRHFRGTGHVLRFIEYMDVGAVNGWDPTSVVDAAEILQRLSAIAPVEPVPAETPSAVARRYRFVDGSLEVGVIASISAPFCGDCSRARLSADGHLYTCLFGTRGHDLKTPLRRGATDAELSRRLAVAWKRRRDRYSELRSQRRPPERGHLPVIDRVEMSFIGG